MCWVENKFPVVDSLFLKVRSSIQICFDCDLCKQGKKVRNKKSPMAKTRMLKDKKSACRNKTKTGFAR
jgi:hypothetical protein